MISQEDFMRYIRELNYEKVLETLDEYPGYANITLGDQTFPLMEATKAGALKIVQLLLSRGSDPNQSTTTEGSRTSLLYAIWQEHDVIFNLLLEHGAKLDCIDRNENNVLHELGLSSKPRQHIAKFVVEKAPELLFKFNSWGVLPLHYVSYKSIDILKLYLDHGVDINTKTKRSSVIKIGTFVDVKFEQGDTILHAVSGKGKIPFVRFLIKNGADPTIINSLSQTPAQLAREKGFPLIADMLQGRNILFNLIENHIKECFKYEPKNTILYKTKSFKKSIDHLTKLIGIHNKPFGQDSTSPTSNDFVVIKTKVQAVNVQELADEYFVNFDEIAESIMETTKNFRNFSKTDLDKQQDEIKELMGKYVLDGNKLSSNDLKPLIMAKIVDLKSKLKDSKLDMGSLEQKSVDKILSAIDKTRSELNNKLHDFDHVKQVGNEMEKNYVDLIGLIENMTGEDIPVQELLSGVHARFNEQVMVNEAKSASSIGERLEMLDKVGNIVYALKDSFQERVKEDMEDNLIELQIYEKLLSK
eukprot:NODE_446_length_8505_cov_0.322032.p1 type:complete len:529 gc:universal NODE_446_length_8505_cov_0.322032:3183-1597(-)